MLVHLSSHTVHSRHRCSMPQAEHDDSPHPFFITYHMIRPLEPRRSTSTLRRFSRVATKNEQRCHLSNLITSIEILFLSDSYKDSIKGMEITNDIFFVSCPAFKPEYGPRCFISEMHCFLEWNNAADKTEGTFIFCDDTAVM